MLKFLSRRKSVKSCVKLLSSSSDFKPVINREVSPSHCLRRASSAPVRAAVAVADHRKRGSPGFMHYENPFAPSLPCLLYNGGAAWTNEQNSWWSQWTADCWQLLITSAVNVVCSDHGQSRLSSRVSMLMQCRLEICVLSRYKWLPLMLQLLGFRISTTSRTAIKYRS